jgi:hypothetical protein
VSSLAISKLEISYSRRYTPSSTSEARVTLGPSVQDHKSVDRVHFHLQHLVTGENDEVQGGRI